MIKTSTFVTIIALTFGIFIYYMYRVNQISTDTELICTLINLWGFCVYMSRERD